jgi:hypothetical protein
VRQHLSGLYRRTGCVNAAQAAYWLGTGGLDSGRKVGPTTLPHDGRAPGRTAFAPEYNPRGKGILNRRAYGT